MMMLLLQMMMMVVVVVEMKVVAVTVVRVICRVGGGSGDYDDGNASDNVIR